MVDQKLAVLSLDCINSTWGPLTRVLNTIWRWLYICAWERAIIYTNHSSNRSYIPCIPRMCAWVHRGQNYMEEGRRAHTCVNASCHVVTELATHSYAFVVALPLCFFSTNTLGLNIRARQTILAFTLPLPSPQNKSSPPGYIHTRIPTEWALRGL